MDFARIQASPTQALDVRTGPIAESDLRAFEQRLELELPASLRAFWLAVGAGDFRFGRILSPLTERGSSEVEDELAEFRVGVNERMFHLQRLEPRRPSVDLLPFARQAGRLFFLDLAGRTAPDRVWSFDSLAEPFDEATPTEDDFSLWLEKHFADHS